MSVIVSAQIDLAAEAAAPAVVYVALPPTNTGFRVIGGRASIKVGNPDDAKVISVYHRTGVTDILLGTFTTGSSADAGDTIEYVKNTTGDADRTIVSPATDKLKLSAVAMGAACTFNIDLTLDEMARIY